MEGILVAIKGFFAAIDPTALGSFLAGIFGGLTSKDTKEKEGNGKGSVNQTVASGGNIFEGNTVQTLNQTNYNGCTFNNQMVNEAASQKSRESAQDADEDLPIIEKYEPEKAWFDRPKKDYEFDKKFKDVRLGNVYGLRDSGRVLTLNRWLEKKGIEPYIYTSDFDMLLMEKTVNQFMTSHKEAVYLILENSEENDLVKRQVLNLLLKHRNLTIYWISERKVNIDIFYDRLKTGAVRIQELLKPEIKSYVSLKGLLLREDQIEKMYNEIGSLPENIRNVMKLMSDYSFEVALKMVKTSPKSMTQKAILETLKPEELKFAKLMSRYDDSIQDWQWKNLCELLGIDIRLLKSLTDKGVVYVKSKFVNMPQEMRLALDEVEVELDPEACKKADMDIARYHFNKYKKINDYAPQRGYLEAGIKSCKLSQRANDFERAQNCLKRLIVVAKKEAMYEELCGLLREQICHYNDTWNLYHLCHCYYITGELALMEEWMENYYRYCSEDTECENAFSYLACCLAYEKGEKVDELVEQKLQACSDVKWRNRIQRILISYYLEKGKLDLAEKVAKAIYDSISDVKYETVVAFADTIRVRIAKKEFIPDADFNEAYGSFDFLDDKRGMAWVDSMHAQWQWMNGCCDYSVFAKAVEERAFFKDCSREYKVWLCEMIPLVADNEDALELIRKEATRIRDKNNYYMQLISKELKKM